MALSQDTYRRFEFKLVNTVLASLDTEEKKESLNLRVEEEIHFLLCA